MNASERRRSIRRRNEGSERQRHEKEVEGDVF